ncbi:MAG: DUF4270 domain-containing protein [Salinimicrobium sp.]
MLKITTVVAVVFSFVACEDDFESIGTEVIGQPGFNAELYDEAEISAHTNKLAPVQTNNLPVYLLGVYNDPVFGKQTASILSQLSLSSTNPDFGAQPVLDSVVLNIPYYSTQLENTEDGQTKYELDSIYGSAPIKLTITETNYFLNNFDPNTDFERAQKYYSNLGPQVENNLTSNVLYQKEDFEFSADEVVVIDESPIAVEDTIRYAPRMRVKLDKDFFQNKILDQQGKAVLASQSNFRNYLRSIYIQAEQTGNSGSMALLNLAADGTGITLYYRAQVEDTEDVDDDGDTSEIIEENRLYNLALGLTKVNTFEQEMPQFDNPDDLYLKGGEGSMAIIDLFSGPDADGDGVSDELEFIRDNNWLVNEANLEFYVNRDMMSSSREPERVYLYNLDQNRLLIDYTLDASGELNDPTSTSNDYHLVPLERDENGNGIKYKIRLTRHINNVLTKDSTNVKLGLVVVQNVNLVNNSAVLQTGGAEVKSVPTGSVVTPEATVLYGPNAENEEKRLKLKIYYTEQKN